MLNGGEILFKENNYTIISIDRLEQCIVNAKTELTKRRLFKLIIKLIGGK